MLCGLGGVGSLAPGLNENAGRGGREAGFPSSPHALEDRPCPSIADLGRLPVAREEGEGAEGDDGRAGKTNGGFGGGLDRGDACAPAARGRSGAVSSTEEVGRSSVAPCSRQLEEEASTITSEPIFVAIFPSRSAAPKPIGNSG